MRTTKIEAQTLFSLNRFELPHKIEIENSTRPPFAPLFLIAKAPDYHVKASLFTKNACLLDKEKQIEQEKRDWWEESALIYNENVISIQLNAAK